MTKTFKEVIAGIRTAIYGREVREDIAQMGEYVEQFANTATTKASEAASSASAAKSSQSAAKTSETNAASSASIAATSASNAKTSETNAASLKTAAASSASAAATSASNAKTSETNAASSQKAAASSQSAAASSASAAKTSETNAASSASAAATSASNAKTSETTSKEYLEQVKTITLGAQGWYETPEALAKAVPIGENGWWAVIGSTDTIWVWDSDSSAWKDTFTATELGDYYTREQIDSKLAGKAASSHKHTKSDITDFPSSLPASDVYSWAKQSTKPGYDFSEINGNVINTEPSTSNHKIILGTQGLNQCEFFEYGGIWNFYKMNPSQELVASIQGDGFHGNVNGKADTAGTADKLGTDAGSATQPVYFAGGKPVACTYTLGKSVPSNAVFTDTNTWRGIQNNLTSTSTTDSLSAAQGKVLNEKIAAAGSGISAVWTNYGTNTGYIRFANEIQICMGCEQSSSSITFPAPFNTSMIAITYSHKFSGQDNPSGIASWSTTDFSITQCYGSVNYIAIGTWK